MQAREGLETSPFRDTHGVREDSNALARGGCLSRPEEHASPGPDPRAATFEECRYEEEEGNGSTGI